MTNKISGVSGTSVSGGTLASISTDSESGKLTLQANKTHVANGKTSGNDARWEIDVLEGTMRAICYGTTSSPKTTVPVSLSADTNIGELGAKFKSIDASITELKNSLSDSKTKVATAITQMGVSSAATESWDILSSNIKNLLDGNALKKLISAQASPLLKANSTWSNSLTCYNGYTLLYIPAKVGDSILIIANNGSSIYRSTVVKETSNNQQSQAIQAVYCCDTTDILLRVAIERCDIYNNYSQACNNCMFNNKNGIRGMYSNDTQVCPGKTNCNHIGGDFLNIDTRNTYLIFGIIKASNASLVKYVKL